MDLVIKQQINRLMVAFPAIRNWFVGLEPGQDDGLRAAWNRQLASCNAADIELAVSDLIDGKHDAPANYEFDRLGICIKRIANIHAERRIQSERLAEFRRDMHAGETTANAVARRCVPAMRSAFEWGNACREGQVTPEQNAAAMDQIHRFHRRGDCDLPTLPTKEQPCQPQA